MTQNLNTATPLLDAALAALKRAGWLITSSIYGGRTAIHPGQQRRLDGLNVADLINLADEEALNSNDPR